MFQLSSRDIVWCVTTVSKGQCLNFIHAKNQQRRKCTHNVTLSCVCAALLLKKSGKYYNCECKFLAFIVIFNLIMLKFYLFLLSIRNPMRMSRIILLSVVCLAVKYFSTLFHKRHSFRNKGIEYKMCILIFSTTFV